MHMMVTGGRIAAVAAGVPIFVATVVLGAFTMAGTLARASEHHAASYAWHGGDITLNTSAGNVEVVSGTGTQVTVEYTEHYQLKRPTVTASLANDGVQLGARCPGGPFVQGCEVNYVLTVPDSARLVVHSGDGGIRIIGGSGAASLDTGNGGIDFDNVSGNIVAHTGDGAITGTRVRSTTIHASTGNGAVNIAWSLAPTTVVATTGNGSIDLLVPRLTDPYRTSTDTGNGAINVSVLTASTAGRTLTARTGNGAITIAYNG
jgi:hypothetical protein